MTTKIFLFVVDIDPCDDTQVSEREISSGFSRMDAVLSASVSLNRSTWIMLSSIR